MSQAAVQDSLCPVIPLTQGEVLAWRKRERLSVADHARRYREVEHGPWKGQRWRDTYTPYLVFPMFVISLPFVRELNVVGPGQGGKTQILYNTWLWAIDNRMVETAVLLLPDENLAKKTSEKRLQRIVKLSPALKLAASPAGQKT
jgi:phage terminase large subunit GpA-like protein